MAKKVTELQIENYKRIVAVNIQLNDHITEISGANGSGKTSSFDALWFLIDGKRVLAEEPIRQGAFRSKVAGKIGEYWVTRTIQRAKTGKDITTGLQIERGDEAMPPTEAFLKGLIGEHMLDPGDFIALSPAAKFDVLRSFVPGVDFTLIANQNRKDYDRRTEVNRIGKEARAAAGVINVPSGTPEALIDEVALTQELADAGDKNAETERRRANRQKVEQDIAAGRAVVASHAERVKKSAETRSLQADAEIARIRSQIKQLQGQIQVIEQNCANEISADTQQLVNECEQAATTVMQLQARLDAAEPLPPPVDVAALQKRLNEARTTNANVRKLQERDKQLTTAEKYETESAQITERMKAREQSKRDAIAKVQLPVPGISFGDGEILLDGVPIDQASTAQKLRVGVAIAVMKNPELRLVWIRDASLLDDRSYDQVKKLAEEFDCQILLETVRPIGKDAIILENGEILPYERVEAQGAEGAAA